VVPGPKSNLVHFSLKIRHQLAATLSVYNMQLRNIGRATYIVLPYQSHSCPNCTLRSSSPDVNINVNVNLYSIALSYSASNALNAPNTAETGASSIGERSRRCWGLDRADRCRVPGPRRAKTARPHYTAGITTSTK